MLVRPGPLLSAAACALLLGALAPACSLSDGDGDIAGTLSVPACWSGKFSLKPDFFAGVPYKNTLQLRIQNGGDYETFSDGVSILIDDVPSIRPSADGSKGLYGVPLEVSLPPAVTPPGVPIQAVASPAHVHLTLYLQRTCRTQNVALYAMDQVLDTDGACSPPDGQNLLPCGTSPAPADDAGAADAGPTPDGGAPPPAGVMRRSRIAFTSLFDGKPDEDVAARRLNEGCFDVYLADPRDVAPGGLGPPPSCRGHLTGRFKFYFQRGRPAQAFP